MLGLRTTERRNERGARAEGNELPYAGHQTRGASTAAIERQKSLVRNNDSEGAPAQRFLRLRARKADTIFLTLNKALEVGRPLYETDAHGHFVRTATGALSRWSLRLPGPRAPA